MRVGARLHVNGGEERGFPRSVLSSAVRSVAAIISDGQRALLDSDFLSQTSSRIMTQCYIRRDKTVNPHH
jgi:hypothetical protein